jgi:CheY-like chemotaxis protein
MVTSMSEDSDEEHARSAGAVGYIVKPFTPDDLSESLSDWLSACPTGSSEQSEPQ